MEKSGLGIFMQMALLRAKVCTRKPSATDVLEWSPMQALTGQYVILKCHPQPYGITSQELSELLGFWTLSIVWYSIS
jgi:S-ribosylhomocysteine lyase LuxS involved in autoinducer biosynthesis